MPTIWRLNISTGASEGVDPRRFCIERKILGVGWPVDAHVGSDWDLYRRAAEELYYKKGDKGWWPALNAIRNRMEVDDLCWTRDWGGLYYIGRITSEWRYEGADENRAADVVNVRDCDWKLVGTADAVPGKIINSYIPSRTVQAVREESVALFSAFLYNSMSADFKYPPGRASADVLTLLSGEDCEDLVGLLLQESGYRIVPSSCKASTPTYECVMKHHATGETAVAQVKQGFVDMAPEEYGLLPGRVFLFTTHGEYVGEAPDNVVCIAADEVRAFIREHRLLLSARIQKWVAMAEQLGSET